MSPPEVSPGEALLEVRALAVRFPQPGRRVLEAVSDVSFSVSRGETLGIVGESGCGKSTLARAILRLVPLAGGSVRFRDRAIEKLEGAALRAVRRHLQIVFQDSRAALDPRMRAAAAIEEPLIALRPELSRAERRTRVAAIVERVGLAPGLAARRPAALSGGQCQRVALARALVVEPDLLVCDEPLSGLDVSLQAQVAALLGELRQSFALTLVLIAHDLALVHRLADRVLVMYLGRVVEIGPCAALFARPGHPYTRALIAAVLVPDPRAPPPPVLVSGEPPSPLAPPSGCAFRTRCAWAVERCASVRPELRPVGGTLVACHRAEELGAATA
jgi:oligopeptide/dipeptide ABC transporter ATP-binding protein